jgi:hypothetical protein
MSKPPAKSNKRLSGIVAPDPAQLMIAGVQPVSMGEGISSNWISEIPSNIPPN